MARVLVILDSKPRREQAARWCMSAPPGTRVEFKETKRSLPQNDRMWAMLTDIAKQQTYHGIRLAPDDWKLLFLDALKREVRMVPNLEDTGMVSLGRSSSDLSRAEMSDLMEIIAEWGARHGVAFSEPGVEPEALTKHAVTV